MEGGHDGHCELPCGCPPAVYGCSRRGHMGPFPRRPGNRYHGTARPVPPPPSRVGHLVTAGTDRTAGGWRQGKEKQQPSPLAPPQALAANSPWWLGVTGLTNRDGFLEDGAIYACQTPGLLRAADVAHVALSVEAGGPRLGFESGPLVKHDGKEELLQDPGKTLSFLYLQLVPPHCFTCRC